MATWLLATLMCAAVGGNSDCTLVYFTADWCQPCQQVRPSLKQLSDEGWDVREVDVDKHAAVVEQFRVAKLPTIVFLSQGNEVDRLVGATPYELIRSRALRVAARSDGMASLASNSRSGASQPARPSQAAPVDATPSLAQPLAAAASPTRPIARGQSPAASGFPMLGTVAAGLREANETRAAAVDAAGPSHVSPGITPQQAMARASEATVRIRVDEANTTAYGTGTIIDVHADEALVLTCGHLFREMNPNSQLTLDLFPGTPRQVNLPAELIDFRAEEEDVGLISFRLPVAVEPVVVLPRGETLEIGQPAFSFGCDHGAAPTRRDTKIKDLNRFVGAANVEIFGAPAVGRSGGGLFDMQGRLVGVCNAADAADDQGIYAAAEVVYAQLQRLGMQHLFQPAEASPSGAPTASASLASSRAAVENANSSDWNEDSEQPAWPDEVGGKVSAGTRAGADAVAEQVICIVKGPQGEDRVITIDGPSSTLLQEIMAHAR